jgi:uncharacterized repeat protein (TIGR02543 family)
MSKILKPVVSRAAKLALCAAVAFVVAAGAAPAAQSALGGGDASAYAADKDKATYRRQIVFLGNTFSGYPRKVEVSKNSWLIITKTGKKLGYWVKRLPTSKASGHKAENYKFLGWYTKEKGGKKVTLDTIVSDKNCDVRGKWFVYFYAHWGVDVKLKFDSNKGKIGKAKVKTIKTYSTLKYGKMPNPKRSGYKFVGWYTKKSGGKKVTANQTIKDKFERDYWRHDEAGDVFTDGTPYYQLLPVKQTITLYAHWKKN